MFRTDLLKGFGSRSVQNQGLCSVPFRDDGVCELLGVVTECDIKIHWNPQSFDHFIEKRCRIRIVLGENFSNGSEILRLGLKPTSHLFNGVRGRDQSFKVIKNAASEVFDRCFRKSNEPVQGNTRSLGFHLHPLVPASFNSQAGIAYCNDHLSSCVRLIAEFLHLCILMLTARVLNLLRQKNYRYKSSDTSKPSTRGRDPISQTVLVRGTCANSVANGRRAENNHSENREHGSWSQPAHSFIAWSNIHPQSPSTLFNHLSESSHASQWVRA